MRLPTVRSNMLGKEAMNLRNYFRGEGNLAAKPVLHTGGSAPFARVVCYIDNSFFDDTTNAWVKGADLKIAIKVTGKKAQKTVEKFEKGDRVMFEGRLGIRTFATEDGRDMVEVNCTVKRIIKLDKLSEEGMEDAMAALIAAYPQAPTAPTATPAQSVTQLVNTIPANNGGALF
jgi:single-stranded DNA-binding protein